MAKIGKLVNLIFGNGVLANANTGCGVIPKPLMPTTLSRAVLVGMIGSATYRLYVVTITTSLTGESRDGRKEQARNAV